MVHRRFVHAKLLNAVDHTSRSSNLIAGFHSWFHRQNFSVLTFANLVALQFQSLMIEVTRSIKYRLVLPKQILGRAHTFALVSSIISSNIVRRFPLCASSFLHSAAPQFGAAWKVVSGQFNLLFRFPTIVYRNRTVSMETIRPITSKQSLGDFLKYRVEWILKMQSNGTSSKPTILLYYDSLLRVRWNGHHFQRQSSSPINIPNHDPFVCQFQPSRLFSHPITNGPVQRCHLIRQSSKSHLLSWKFSLKKGILLLNRTMSKNKHPFSNSQNTVKWPPNNRKASQIARHSLQLNV
jgi:hypothetical protein